MTGPIRRGRLQLPGSIRYVLPSHAALLALESHYFRKTPKALVPCSQQVADDVERLFHLKAPETVVIYNGFDPAYFSPDRAAALRPQMRESLGVPEGATVLLMVANEWQRKGLGVLLEALAQLPPGQVRLLLVGRQEPGAFATRIRELGLGPSVHYVGATADVARYHAASDLFVLPTQYEPFGLVILEALASGLPVLTTAHAGAAFLVNDGVNGMLLDDPQDAGKLAALLRSALAPGVLEAMAAEAAKSAVGFDWATLMAQLEDVLTGCAAAPG